MFYDPLTTSRDVATANILRLDMHAPT